MQFPKYPKIETLFDRDKETFKVIEGRLRCPEFAAVRRWLVTEKIDGTNIRVHLTSEGDRKIAGRTDNAQIHPLLLDHIAYTIREKALREAFPNGAPVTLFGEGYGPKIQSGGKYRSSPGFRLFDVSVDGIWLRQDSVGEIGKTLGIDIAPVLQTMDMDDAVELVRHGIASATALKDSCRSDVPAEGIVARSEPLMLDRMGRRIMWKLKTKDFARED